MTLGELIAQNNLQAIWALNGAATDASGNAATLTLVNTPVYAQGKLGGQALDLESSSSQYAFVADTAPLSITGDMTIMALLNWESLTGGEMTICGKYEATGNNRDYLILWNDTGDNFQFYMSSDGSSVLNINVAFTPTLSTWYHMVWVYTAASGKAELFINGASIGSGTGLATSIHNGTGRFAIGAYNTNSTATSFFDGKIDELAVFNRAFTPQEIRVRYGLIAGKLE